MEYISKKIVELRKQRYMTQADLAKELNVTYQAVSKWENAISEPDFKTMIKMSKIFKVSIYEFIEGEKER